MTLKIYNTLSKQKEIFTPLVPGQVRMYVCGMTVYDYCHLGHARVLVSFDVITRYLRASGFDVTYVRNITDVDDKIIKRAGENNESCEQLTERFIDAMHEDEARLGVLSPDLEPRATAHIGDIVAMIEVLIAKGYAYAADNGDVYYRVARFENYGKLTNKNLEDLIAGARVEVGEAKEDPRDFALWKSAKNDEVSWQSPWGRGRPGWHIECSAMSKHCLGDTFDIHGGGPDLPFPHHENEIAQSEAANGCRYVNTWMHAGAVRVDGEKMSKSLGNFFTIREILDKYHPEVVRYLLLSSHYRSAINYSEDNLKDAKAALDRFYQALKKFKDVPAIKLDALSDNTYGRRFFEAMDDDFNTPVAVAVLFDLVRDLNSAAAENDEKAKLLAATLKALSAILGILQCDPESYLQSGGADQLSVSEIEAAIERRVQARASKDFALADQIRDELLSKGVVLEDTRDPQSKAIKTHWRRQ